MRTAEQEREIAERLTLFQSRYDESLAPFQRHAPAPVEGESVNSYRRRALGYLQSYTSPDNPWRGKSLAGLMSDALNVADAQVVNDVLEVSRRPKLMATTPAARIDSLDPNIKAIECNDGGTQSTRYYGQSFVVGMGRPGRLVTSFTTDHGKYRFVCGGGRWF
jgi:hypothetical protein